MSLADRSRTPERVLHDMYSAHEGELARMVAQINKRRGPRRARG